MHANSRHNSRRSKRTKPGLYVTLGEYQRLQADMKVSPAPGFAGNRLLAFGTKPERRSWLYALAQEFCMDLIACQVVIIFLPNSFRCQTLYRPVAGMRSLGGLSFRFVLCSKPHHSAKWSSICVRRFSTTAGQICQLGHDVTRRDMAKIPVVIVACKNQIPCCFGPDSELPL